MQYVRSKEKQKKTSASSFELLIYINGWLGWLGNMLRGNNLILYALLFGF